MSAGSVLLMTGKNKCTDLGGLFRTMPFTMLMGVIGALAISSFPLTSGFISKSMISQGAADAHMAIVWFMLAAASAGVFLHAGIKFPWFVFFQKDSGMRPPEPPWNMRAGMVVMAVFCIGLGLWPSPLYDLLPYPVDYVPYTASHVVFQLQLLLFSGLAFFIMLDLLKRTETITLDTDWFYRKLGKWVMRGLNDGSERAWDRLMARADDTLSKVNSGLYHFHGPDGIFGRTWPTGQMAFWTTVMLGAYVLLSYV
jgi:multicomponent Na+:H+ antiporter subunit D